MIFHRRRPPGRAYAPSEALGLRLRRARRRRRRISAGVAMALGTLAALAGAGLGPAVNAEAGRGAVGPKIDIVNEDITEYSTSTARVVNTPLSEDGLTTGWGPHLVTTGRTPDDRYEWHLGSYISGDGTVAFCAFDDRTSGPGFADGTTVYKQARQRDELAYDIIVAGTSYDSVTGEVSPEQLAQINYLMYFAARAEDPYWSAVYRAAMNEVIGQWDISMHNAVIDQAYEREKFIRDMKQAAGDAAQFAGPYVLSMEVEAPRDMGADGVVKWDLRSAAGNEVRNKDFPILLKIDGPAVFTANGKQAINVSAGEVSQRIHSTGAGQVKVTVHAPALPGDFTVYYHEPYGSNVSRSQGLMTGTEKAATSRVMADIVPAPLRVEINTQAQFVDNTDVRTTLDTVEVRSQGRWPEGETLAVDMTLYGPFASAYKEGARIPEDAPRAGEQRLEFRGPGTMTTDPVAVQRPGFYTWVAQVDPDQQTPAMRRALDSTPYRSQFFDSAESVIAPAIPHITTSVDRSEITTGEKTTDVITIEGVIEGHGTFVGLGSWSADNTELIQRLYGPFDIRPTAQTSLGDAPVVHEEALVMANGVQSTQAVELSEPGWYVWVSHYSGDTRLAPVSTSPGDQTEQVYVRLPGIPTVSTSAVEEAKLGEAVFDRARISDPEDYIGRHHRGDEVTFALGFTAYADPGCLEPVFISSWQQVSGGGDYESQSFTPEHVGKIYWREALIEIHGGASDIIGSSIGLDAFLEPHVVVLGRGECGTPGETTTVGPLPKEPPAPLEQPPPMPPTGISHGALSIGFAVLFIISGSAFVIIRRNNRDHEDV